MSGSDAVSVNKLASCLELSFKESKGARKALREWLDELDRADDAKKSASTPTGPAVPSQQESQPRTHVQQQEAHVETYYGVSAYYNLDPRDYKWLLEGGNERSRVVYFERELPTGLVKMNYYYTTGTVQLTYNNKYYVESSDGDDYYYSLGIIEPRRIQETFKDLDLDDFSKLLRNPPTFYGKGIYSS